jgi:hypothetical protein
MRTTLAFFSLGLVLASPASGPVDVTVTPDIREYCHIVRFPLGWKTGRYDPKIHQPLSYSYDNPYEFRVPGELETTFLVGGIVLPSKQYTINKYRVDLSDPAGIAQPVSEKEWQSAAIIPDTRLVDYSRNFARLRFINSEPLVLNSRQFPKTGDIWAGQCARLSPDRSWIVLLSSSGTIAKRDEFLILGGRDKGRLFLDFYKVETGKKLITIVGSYLDINPQALNQGLWVTERYFILPLGAHRERSVVCDVGRVERKARLKP